jgi:hypothetical protein
MRICHKTLIALLLGASVIAGLYLSPGRILVFFLHQRGFDASYKRSANNAFRELVFKDFLVIDKKRGIGFIAHKASIRPRYHTLLSGAATIDFRLFDFHFIAAKNPAEVKASADMNDLLVIPFSGSSIYGEVSGTIQSSKDRLYFENITANGQAIGLSLKGSIYNDQKADIDITVRFTRDLLAGIPEDWSKVVLSDEPNGWKSLSANLKGDLSKPSLQVTGKLFRLNIREK